MTCKLLADTTVSEPLKSKLERIELGIAVKLLKVLVATVGVAESSSEAPDTAGRVAMTGLLTVLESEETDTILSEEVPSGSSASFEDDAASTDDTPLEDGVAPGEGTIPDSDEIVMIEAKLEPLKEIPLGNSAGIDTLAELVEPFAGLGALVAGEVAAVVADTELEPGRALELAEELTSDELETTELTKLFNVLLLCTVVAVAGETTIDRLVVTTLFESLDAAILDDCVLDIRALDMAISDDCPLGVCILADTMEVRTPDAAPLDCDPSEMKELIGLEDEVATELLLIELPEVDMLRNAPAKVTVLDIKVEAPTVFGT